MTIFHTLLHKVIVLDVSLNDLFQQYATPPWAYDVMRFFSDKTHIWYAVIVFVPALLIANWKKALIFACVLGLAIAGADQASCLLKHHVARPRPEHVTYDAHPESVSPHSFPSSHAANITAALLVIWVFWPPCRIPTLFVWFVVCYGRLYLRKHYPLDVACGALIGCCSAWIALFVWGRIRKKWNVTFGR